MNASRLMIAAACTLAVAGAATVAFAQTTTPGAQSSPTTTYPVQTPNQGQNTGPMQGQTPSTTNRDNATSGSMNAEVQRQSDDSLRSGTTGTPGSSGTNSSDRTNGTNGTDAAYGRSGKSGSSGSRNADGSMRSPSDRSTMESERAARADRN